MTDVLRQLIATRSTILADVDQGSDARERLLVRSNRTGTMQVFELTAAGVLGQVTALPEPVATARYVPGSRRAVIEVDAGGTERHQLYLVDLDTAAADGPADIDGLTPLTRDPRYGHHVAGVAPDGSAVAYLSNRRNGVDFDLWTCDLGTGEHRCVYSGGGWCQPASGYSPDGRWVAIVRPGPRPLDTEVLLVGIGTGLVQTPLAHPHEAAEVGSPAWIDATRCFLSSNVGTDRAGVVSYALASGAAVPLGARGEHWDATPITSRDGRTLVLIENRNGASWMSLGASDAPDQRTDIATVEPGVVVDPSIPPPVLSADGRHLYYSLSTPRRACEVFAYDRESDRTRRLTDGPDAIDPDRLVTPEAAEVVSFDGERIPLFVYRPTAGDARPPVVVQIHGGPEGQSVLAFDAVVQGLAAVGYAVVVPNVRGSAGYGKRFSALDDTTRRLDSVRDLGAVHAGLAALGLDGSRAALWGASYGGYMVLAGLAFQPELWAAGVDIVGISDLVTFLENTADYRRAHREREYGSLARDRDFLARASPLRHADAIRAPLFLVHGRNDPRVPVSEAEQLVATLRRRGLRADLTVYDDEGHGLARLANRLDAYPRAVAFLDEVLRP